MSKVAICAVVKDGGDMVGEWIAYHLAAGFDIVAVYDNGSTDDTAAIVSAAAQMADVRLVPWPDSSAEFQVACYMNCVEALKPEAEWIAFADCDEFFVFARDGDVKSFLARMDEAQAIAVPELFFGSSGHRETPRELMITAYTNRAPDAFGPNQHVKSLVRPRAVRRHANPHAFVVDGSYVDPDGTVTEWLSAGITKQVRAHDVAHVNHYFTRSHEDWMAKLHRGYRDGTARRVDDFNDYDRNEVPDDLATRHLAGTVANLARLRRAMTREGAGRRSAGRMGGATSAEASAVRGVASAFAGLASWVKRLL